MKQIFFIAFICISFKSFSQVSNFSVYHNGELNKIENVSSGGYITTGKDSLQGQQCVRWGAGFNQIWSFKLPNNGFIPTACLVIEANDGNFYLSAYSSVNNGSLTVFKLSSSGVLLWQKTYTGSAVNFGLYAPTISKGAGNDKGFIFGTGSCSLSNAIVKCDENGNIVWQKSFNTPLSTGVTTCSSILTEGNHYIVSSSYNVKSLLTFKLDSLGNVITHTAYKYNEAAQIFPLKLIKLQETNGYALIARCNNSNNQIQYVVFFNSSLNITSFNELTVPYQEFTLFDICAVEKGNVVINGIIFDSNKSYAPIIKVSSQGNLIWYKTAHTANENNLFYPYFEYHGLATKNNMILSVGRSMTEGSVVSMLDTAGQGICEERPLTLTNVHRTLVQEFSNLSGYGSTALVNTANYACTYQVPFTKTLICGTMPNSVEAIQNLADEFQIFPNPANEQLQLKSLHPNAEPSHIDILSLDGKIIYQSTFENSMKIQTCNFANGIYILSFKNKDGVRYAKFQVQH